MPLPLVLSSAAQGNAVVKEHVVSDLCGLSDDDAHTVVDDEAAADPGAGMDLNAGDVSGDLGIEPGQKVCLEQSTF